MSDWADQAARMIVQWKRDPVLFVRQVLGAEPTAQQEELLRAVPHERMLAVKSGHGTGKDACASWLILWFLMTRPHSRGVATAPTFRQLNDVLWGELAKWIRGSVLADEFEIGKDVIYLRAYKRTWFFRAATCNLKASADEQAETLAGYHADHFLVVVDEASGVPDPVFRPLEGILTGEDNKVLLIGNPTRDTGYFYDAFHRDARRWRTFTWNSEDSPIVSREMISFYADKYGRDSDPYRVRVLGEFPRASSDRLFSRARVEQCVQLWHDVDAEAAMQEPLVCGLDVARSGGDRSVLTLRYGMYVREQHYTYEHDTMAMCEWVLDKLAGLEPSAVYVDVIGMGGPVADRLRQLGLNVIDVNVSWKSSDNTQWRRLRDELWMSLRDRVHEGRIALPPSSELVDELCSIPVRWPQGGAAVVGSKDEIRKELGFSPDLADSLMLTEYDADGALVQAWHTARSRYRRRLARYGKISWKVI